MGNQKGYVPSEGARRKVSESLKKAYADGTRESREGCSVSEEVKQKLSVTLKQGYVDGRSLAGAALRSSLVPKISDEERRAKRTEQQRLRRAKNASGSSDAI